MVPASAADWFISLLRVALMPVRFRCYGCQRVLNALERKIGERVNCPGCGTLLVVPEGDTVPSPPGVPLDSEATSSAARADFGESWASSGGFRISRRVIYAQAVLLAIAAAGFFVAGYFIGRGKKPAPSGDSGSRTIAVTGHIELVGPGGAFVPDAGAAVLILPAERKPRRDAKIDAAVLGPLAPLPAENDLALAHVESLGGAYARTDERGDFRLSFPQRGSYHVLVLSREPAGDEEPSRADLAVVGEYVVDALGLLGPQRYHLATADLADGSRFEHRFSE